MSADDVNTRKNEAFVYDEYKWQINNEIHVKNKDRAKGLHKVLYQCRDCGAEFEMDSDGNQVWCNHCGASWTMSTLGELVAQHRLVFTLALPLFNHSMTRGD